MPNDFLTSTQSWAEKQIQAPIGPRPVFATRTFKTAQGEHAAGKIVSKGADGELVAAAKETETDNGDGAAVQFTFQFADLLPLAPGTLRIVTADAAPQTLSDDGRGGLYATDGTASFGTANYAKGEVVVDFATAPANTVAITATAYGRLEGVCPQAVDTAKVDEAPVIVFGALNAGELLVGTSAPDEAVLEGLREKGFFPMSAQ